MLNLFHLQIVTDFTLYDLIHSTLFFRFDQFNATLASELSLSRQDADDVRKRIQLDEIVYNYAKILFAQRLKAALKQDGLTVVPL